MMEIRKVTKHEINQVVTIHKKAFNDFFLTQLGDKFLWVYYYSVSKNKNSILIGYYDDEKLLGFSCATFLSRGFHKNLVKENLLRFGIIGIKLIFTKPGSLIRILKNFSKSNKSIKDDGNYAELLSIGVYPGIQGSGIGKQLLTELERQLSFNGIKLLSLTTDFYKNDKTIGFYKSLGYEIMYEFIAYPNRKMYRLIKNL
ncbi:MAG: GNAT family N-acetyltransferase [Bacteroidia bacterium]|nr:GNAT family N-acetyltransferase [Bacteroidia bacterium]